MERLTKREGKHTIRIGNEWRRHDPVWDKLAYYEDLIEQGVLVEVTSCKDCTRRDEYCGMGEHKWCNLWKGVTGPNDFCSYAKPS